MVVLRFFSWSIGVNSAIGTVDMVGQMHYNRYVCIFAFYGTDGEQKDSVNKLPYPALENQ